MILMLLISGSSSHGQQLPVLTIEEAYKLARSNYPLTKQRDLITKTAQLTIANAAKGYLPVLVMNGQATYQSTVTNFPFIIPIPGFSLPKYSKDQYKLYFEVDQVIYDRGMIKNQQQVAKTTAAVQEQSLEVELYQLYSKVNDLFFGVLLIDEQLKQNGLLLSDVHHAIDKTKALIANGVAYRSSIDELEAQFLQTGQDSISLMANRKAYVAMLSLFINRSLDEQTIFERPIPPVLENGVSRPELLLYDYQKKVYEDQHRLLNLQLLPKLGLFAQGGYGRPGLNMLSNGFSWYYSGGLKLTWNFGSLYTHKNQLDLLQVGNEMIDSRAETFLFNNGIAQAQQKTVIARYRELLETDDQIVALRLSVKNSANAKLQNGVLSTHDYITLINAENEARQNRVLHETLLLQALFNYKNITGNAKK
ncbi:TolC family protein [Pedobacter sp. PLR]|uniref:TolC family protein n=1 Tax=Pedobacter sp. PLR TaxID=2994465 RepID=UPI0022460D69|nr:TolC family protein [Pedobacter sp. PLR]MCX2452420.1 TolC family protein [Pedobacter sp. PLR]